MFEELNRLAGWSTEKLPEQQVIYITDKGCDGTFLLHHFIALYLKAGQRVLLVTAAQSFAHFSVACGRLGVNLERARNEDKLFHVDMMDAGLRESLGGDSSDTGQELELCYTENTLKYLHNKILAQVQGFDSNVKTVVILDDLTLFVSLGISVDDVAEFYRGMKYIARTFGVAFVTHLHMDGVAENAPTLYPNLRCYGTCELKLKGLESGYSKDVHGNLTLVQKCQKGLRTVFEEKVRQYKITERSLRLFAPGTSKAVL